MNTMIREKRFLNYLDMGMGKSLTTLLSVTSLNAFPLLILCTKSATGVMQEEMMEWFGIESVIYTGTPKQRDQAWYEYIAGNHKVLIANYAMAEELSGRFGITRYDKLRVHPNGMLTAKAKPTPGTVAKPRALVCDEIQRSGIFNHKTKTYKDIRIIAKETEVCYLLTGTPYRKGVVDLYGPLSIIRPDKFDSFWQYVGRYCRVEKTPFGKQIERIPADLHKFRAMFRTYGVVAKKEDHLDELPGKIRQSIPVTMNAEQAKVHKELIEELFSITSSGDLLITPSQLTLGTRLRQLLVAPQVLGLKGRGAAIDSLIEMAEPLVAEDKPFVVFTPFRKAIPFIAQALAEEYPELPKPVIIEGQLTPDEFTKRWQSFQKATGKGVMICVIKSGASFHATRASTAFFLGCEYDFNENFQAEDRLYRMGQKNTVTCYYFLHKGTIEDRVIELLNQKVFSADLVLSTEKALQGLLKKGKR